MKFWKSFSFFFVYPFTMMLIGFFSGAVFMDQFYPRERDPVMREEEAPADTAGDRVAADESAGAEDRAGSDEGTRLYSEAAGTGEEEASVEFPAAEEAPSLETALLGERLDANTAYVLEETDLRNESVVETTWKLPSKYVGMTRKEFLEAMDLYEAAPPLSELERGFVGLEVLSFSPEQVVVRMNYEYVQPSSSFYLAVEDNYVVVYLDDRKTVYMYTDILLTDLPDEVQQDIIHWLYVPDEEGLYNFLENHTS